MLLIIKQSLANSLEYFYHEQKETYDLYKIKNDWNSLTLFNYL